MKTWIASALALLAAPVVASATADAAPLRNSTGAYELQVLVGGAPAQTFGHNGETYVLGSHGDRYTLRVQNHSGQRIEAVVSVDGRDVVDAGSGDDIVLASAWNKSAGGVKDGPPAPGLLQPPQTRSRQPTRRARS